MTIRPYLHSVNYYETDQMAVVHHSNYIRWFEEARIAWLAQAGADYVGMEARGIIIPVVNVSCQYKAMTRFGETVEVRFTGGHYNGIRMSLTYEVRGAADDVLHATGSSEHCFLDREGHVLNLRRSAPDLHEKLSTFFAAACKE